MAWFEIYLVAIVVAITAALPGVFLVIRGTTMLSDAITHSLLLGIVLAFFITNDLNSPLLLFGATIVGLVVVWLIEALQQTRLMNKDAAIGIVFPLFFSLAIIFITRYAGNVHLDTDSVLLGELAFVPFRRMIVSGFDIGPQSLWVMLVILAINVTFISLFYKELKVSTFDPIYSAAIGFSPIVIHYTLMGLVSLTAVGAYDAVGSVLVVGFMVGPSLTGYLLSDNLKNIIIITMIAAIINSTVGITIARSMDVSLAGMIALITGVTVVLAFLFSPKKGFVQKMWQYNKKKKEFSAWLLANRK